MQSNDKTGNDIWTVRDAIWLKKFTMRLTVFEFDPISYDGRLLGKRAFKK